MSTEPDPFLALDVTSDDYATTAAQDQKAGADATPAAADAEDDSDAEREKAGAARAARTAYTEQDFLAQKESYTARIDEGSIWKQLLDFEPPFRPSREFCEAVGVKVAELPSSSTVDESGAEKEKAKLDKKHHQAIVAAVSELYFLQKYDAVKEIVTWARENFQKDKKWDQQLEKWDDRLRAKLGTK